MDCIQQWFLRNNNCPQCRTPIIINSPSEAVISFFPEIIPENSSSSRARIVPAPLPPLPGYQTRVQQVPEIEQVISQALAIETNQQNIQQNIPIRFLQQYRLENILTCIYIFICTCFQEYLSFSCNLSFYFYIIFPVTNIFLLLVSSKRGNKISKWVKLPIFSFIVVYSIVLCLNSSLLFGEKPFSYFFLTSWIFTVNSFNLFYAIFFFLF